MAKGSKELGNGTVTVRNALKVLVGYAARLCLSARRRALRGHRPAGGQVPRARQPGVTRRRSRPTAASVIRAARISGTFPPSPLQRCELEPDPIHSRGQCARHPRGAKVRERTHLSSSAAAGSCIAENLAPHRSSQGEQALALRRRSLLAGKHPAVIFAHPVRAPIRQADQRDAAIVGIAFPADEFEPLEVVEVRQRLLSAGPADPTAGSCRVHRRRPLSSRSRRCRRRSMAAL